MSFKFQTETDQKEKMSKNKRSSSKRNVNLPLEDSPPTVFNNKESNTCNTDNKENNLCSKSTKSQLENLNDPSVTCSSIHIQLETPQKTDINFGVPPTPKYMKTPGDCAVQQNPNLEMSVKSFCTLNTPVFPPITPCVIMTPKLVENEKKPSPYYEPSEEPLKRKESRGLGDQNNLENNTTNQNDVHDLEEKESKLFVNNEKISVSSKITMFIIIILI